MAKYTKEEKIKLLEVKLKQLKASNSKEERKERTRKLIEIGAYFASISDYNQVHEAVKNDTDFAFKNHVAKFLNFKKSQNG
jgi:predicted aconitase